MVLLGTRPEAVKLAPIILGLNESEHFDPIVVATAQHREMLDQVTSLFRIEPHVDLDIMRARRSMRRMSSSFRETPQRHSPARWQLTTTRRLSFTSRRVSGRSSATRRSRRR
jgi:hypothetical protein